MCIVAYKYFKEKNGIKLVLGFNRDELYDRKWKEPGFHWGNNLFGCKDIQSSGEFYRQSVDQTEVLYSDSGYHIKNNNPSSPVCQPRIIGAEDEMSEVCRNVPVSTAHETTNSVSSTLTCLPAAM